jgi:hypothetical protein
MLRWKIAERSWPPRMAGPKAKSRCYQPKSLAAQSLTYKPPKWFLRWQPGLAKHKLPICIPTSNRRSMLPGRHAIRFHLPSFPCGTFGLFSPISHSLRSVVPLGSFFGGCPPPPVTFPATRLNFRRATWLPFSGSFPKGATRFYPGARKKSFDLFLASLSASATSVIVSTNRSVFTLSQSVTTLFACLFAGLKDRNLRDGQSYT